MKDFFVNVERYVRYLISFTLGIFFALFASVKPLLKNPIALTALIGIVIGSLTFTILTLRAMLGLSVV